MGQYGRALRSLQARRQAAENELTDFGLSAQVLQEFYATVTRILKVPLPPKEVMAFLDRFHAFPLVATDFSLVTEGIRNSVKFQVSFWDGAVIAAAERLKAKTFYSEDLNVGRCCGEVTIVNPFVVSSDP